MTNPVVQQLQLFCDAMENATAEQVADLMRKERVVVHNLDDLSDDRPIIGSKFVIQDTVRTKTSPDGHFASFYVTAYPFMDGRVRRWKFQKGRPSDDLHLTG